MTLKSFHNFSKFKINHQEKKVMFYSDFSEIDQKMFNDAFEQLDINFGIYFVNLKKETKE